MFHHVISKAKLVTFSIHFFLRFQLLGVLLGQVWFCLLLFLNIIIVSSHLQQFTTKINVIKTFPQEYLLFLISHTFQCSASNSRIGAIPFLWPAMEVTSPSERITTLLRKDYCSHPISTVQIVIQHSLKMKRSPSSHTAEK